MRRVHRIATILIASGLGLALMALALGALLLATTTPAQANTRPNVTLAPAALPPNQQEVITSAPRVVTPTQYAPGVPIVGEAPSLPDWVVALENAEKAGEISAAANNLSIVLSAPATVLNGETITYTITITNNSPTDDATDITILDIPPEDTLDRNVHCSGCVQVTHTVTIPGGEFFEGVVITVTDQITWFIPSLGPGAVTQTVFLIDVPCQAEGAALESQAFINYQQGGGPGSGTSDPTETTVQLPSVQGGGAGLVDEPSWCANESGGTYESDWGDFDQDGDLDLVLASTRGAMVYRNNEGQLKRFWTSSDFAYGVRWANVDSDGYLELAAVGDNLFNYIYDYNGSGFTQIQVFPSDTQLFRIEPGDYDDDNDIDLIGSSVAVHPQCAVRLYRNGAGTFTAVNPCISTWEGTPNIAPGDYNNDGYLDLAILREQSNVIWVAINDGAGDLSTTHVTVDSGVTQSPYDYAWGDYDGDGYLDLAAAMTPFFGGAPEVRVYHNHAGSGFGLTQTISTSSRPYAVAWGDFDGDGRLELALGDRPPKMYRYTNGSFSQFTALPAGVGNTIWQMQGGDYDNDSDLDLVFTDLLAQSLLFSNIAPFLAPTLTAIDSFRANSVAWGDADGDGDLDLLFGAGGGASDLGSRLYENVGGTFSLDATFIRSGFGPHSAAFGDVNGDGKLDVAVGTLGRNQIYLNGNTGSPDWSSSSSSASHSLAWADVDLSNDGNLDLLVGNDGRNSLFLNVGLRSKTCAPDWQSAATDDTRSVAWGYYDSDSLPDFAAGNHGHPTRVYRNIDGKTFTSVWATTDSHNTRSVAWGDYDGDGDMDLAVGNYGQVNYIYTNRGGSLSSTPFAISTATSNTTSLAWGDWNNDGQLDLAVGNYNQKDQVYANLGSKPGSPNLVLLWESKESYKTTGVAWGDMDTDGDLDLAISQDGTGQNGVYENTYVLAAHLTDDFVKDMPLPNNPSYVSVARPGHTAAAYFFSSAEVFSITTPLNPPTTTLVITIPFRVYDPDGTRDTDIPNAAGDIAKAVYHFSLDGGITWEKATTTATTYDGTTYRLGHSTNPPGYWTVAWDAGTDLNDTDEAVSDNVRFRITVVHQNETGPVQRATTNAVSPPFRVRNLECVWPDNASIVVQTPIMPGVPAIFMGTVSEAQGQVTFKWDFGDGTTAQGQIVQHTYNASGRYNVTLTVVGPACPVAREAVAIKTVTVGTGAGDIYLPVILKSSTGGRAAGITPEPTGGVEAPTPTPEAGLGVFTLDNAPGSPAQVTGLAGSVQPGGTALQWSPNPPEEAVLGYRVYRASVGVIPFQLLAEVPTAVTTYTDETATCGQMYFVTAYNAAGESLPSTSSYFSPPCR